MKGQRDTSLDYIRLLACFMVVLMHSPIPSPDADGMILAPLSYVTAPCIGLFFMVSGALLMPVKGDYVSFVGRRFGKIALPTLFWTLIYVALKLYDSESEINLMQTLASIPFAPQGEGVLWFMYTLAGLYLLAPILSAWVEKASVRDIELVLSLWVVTLCYPLLKLWFYTNSGTTGILYYFTGYAGYFLAGCYLKKYPGRIPMWLFWSVAVSGMLLMLALKYFGIVYDFYSLFWYESIFIAALAVALWQTVVYVARRNRPAGRTVVTLSNLSFGIYLTHILIMRHWLWDCSWIAAISNYGLQCLVIAVLTFVFSALACLLISYLPMSQWVIACHMNWRKK
ncbi:MAG: acyltransferase [Muribaculaceae bacterium]|nr:acyltransferase [Muribaculaceae bacterium]